MVIIHGYNTMKKLSLLFTAFLCASTYVLASDPEGKSLIPQLKVQNVTPEEIATCKQLYSLASHFYNNGQKDLARSAIEKLIQHRAYKIVSSRETLFKDLETFIPLYLNEDGKNKTQGRHLVFQTYLHEPDILQYLTRKKAYILWELAGSECLIQKNQESAKRYYSYFIFAPDIESYFNEEQLFTLTIRCADLYPLDSKEGFKLRQKSLSLKKFQEELQKNPIPYLLFCEKTLIASQDQADLKEQLGILNLYLFHPNMVNMLQQTKVYHGVLKALDVLWHAKYYANYTKAYSLYFPLLSKSGQFNSDALRYLQMQAAVSYNYQKHYHEAINLLVPLLEQRGGSLADLFLAKESLAVAYWHSQEKQKAIELFKEITSHPQLETTSLQPVLLSTAMQYFGNNKDYDLVAQAADRCFKYMPAFFKSHEATEGSTILCIALTAYMHMDERNKIKQLVHTLEELLRVKKTPSLDKQEALLNPVALGYWFLGNSELCIQYIEQDLKGQLDLSTPLSLAKVKILASEYYTQGKYDKASEWFGKVQEKLPLLEQAYTVLSYVKAGSLRKARTLSLHLEPLLKSEEFLPVLNAQLVLAYAFAQSNIEKDHQKSRSFIESLKDLASFVVLADEEKLISNKEYALGLTLLDISQGGDLVFNQLQKYNLEPFKIDRYEEASASSVFAYDSSLPINLKKDILTLHAEHKKKIKRKGISDPTKAKDIEEETSKEATDNDKTTPLPLLITSGAHSLIESFQSSDWKNVNAIRWHHIETFFASHQGSAGIVFTSHGSGTDHVTYTIYKRSTDLNDTTKTPENKMVTLVNEGSRNAPIKFYLKKKLRDILIEMGYLSPENRKA